MNSQTRGLAALAPTLIALLLTGLPASAQESPAERLAKIIKKDADSIKSVEVRVRTDFVLPKTDLDNPGQAEYMLDRYIETAEGSRFAEFRGMRGDQMTSRSLSWGHNGQFAAALYDQNDPNLQVQFHFLKKYWQEDRSEIKWVPHPLRFRYVGQLPIHEALRHGNHVGPSRVLDRPCEMFLFPRVKWMVVQDQVFHLDRETGLTLKVESYLDAKQREAGKPMWVWTAEEIATVQTHPVVMRSISISPASDRDVERRLKFTTESIVFDKEYPDSQFTPVIGPGVNVIGLDGQPALPPP